MQKKWLLQDAKDIFNLPLIELLYEAQTVHKDHFSPNEVQISTLLSIKTKKELFSKVKSKRSWIY